VHAKVASSSVLFDSIGQEAGHVAPERKAGIVRAEAEKAARWWGRAAAAEHSMIAPADNRSDTDASCATR
jgi:hypothetical protein